jgi:hypothetical protein
VWQISHVGRCLHINGYIQKKTGHIGSTDRLVSFSLLVHHRRSHSGKRQDGHSSFLLQYLGTLYVVPNDKMMGVGRIGKDLQGSGRCLMEVSFHHLPVKERDHWQTPRRRLEDSIFVIPFYLQSVPVHSANCVKTYTMALRRVHSSSPLKLIGSRPLVAFGNKTYRPNLTN